MRVFLIRHPRPAIAPDVCYGATDLDLAEDVSRCAARLRPSLPSALRLFSSPLLRCRRLAEALHAAPCYDERLREMDFGDWEMRSWSEIPRIDLDAWAAAPVSYVPPRGESVSAVRKRVVDFLRQHAGPGASDFAAVTHAGVMRIFAAQLHRLPEGAWLNLRFDYGEMTTLEGPTDGTG